MPFITAVLVPKAEEAIVNEVTYTSEAEAVAVVQELLRVLPEQGDRIGVSDVESSDLFGFVFDNECGSHIHAQWVTQDASVVNLTEFPSEREAYEWAIAFAGQPVDDIAG